jgi:hypothetical protein
LPSKEPGLVRELALQAWRDMRGRPAMWLLLSASTLPFVFLLNFVISTATGGLDLALFLSGYAVTFALYFLFWCMAVIFYDSEAREKASGSYREAFREMTGWAKPAFLTGLVAGLISVVAFMIAQLVVGLILSFIAAGQNSQGSLLALSYIHFYLSFLAADLIIVFIGLVPQMLMLERGRKVEEVIRVSYQKVRERYRDAFFLFIIPELVTRTLLIGALFLISRVPGVIPIFILLLLSMALLEGVRTTFVAAAFNRFYYFILEEETKKRKAKPKKQAQKQVRRS